MSIELLFPVAIVYGGIAYGVYAVAINGDTQGHPVIAVTKSLFWAAIWPFILLAQIGSKIARGF